MGRRRQLSSTKAKSEVVRCSEDAYALLMKVGGLKGMTIGAALDYFVEKYGKQELTQLLKDELKKNS